MSFTEDACDAMDAHRDRCKEDEHIVEPPQCAHGRGDDRCEYDEGHRGGHTWKCDDPSCCEPRPLDAEAVANLRWHHFGEGR